MGDGLVVINGTYNRPFDKKTKEQKRFAGPLIAFKNSCFVSLSHVCVMEGTSGLALADDCFYITLAHITVRHTNSVLISPDNLPCHCIVRTNVVADEVEGGCMQKVHDLELHHK